VGGRVGAGGPRWTLVDLYACQVNQLEVLTWQEVNRAMVDLVDLKGLGAFAQGPGVRPPRCIREGAGADATWVDKVHQVHQVYVKC
jgi:hypothetical protein